ncbi:hypothetical protein [Spirosoma pomorum]
MSTTTYKAADRGKMVTIGSGESARVYSKALATAKTDEFISGPNTVGTTTGNRISDGTFTWLEIIRSSMLPIGGFGVVFIYLLDDDVTLVDNPNYNPLDDLDRPSEVVIDEPNKNPTSTTKTDPYGTGEVGPIVITKTPTTGKTSDEVIDETVPGDSNKKWLTYGLYAVLGVAVVTLTIIIVKSIQKPKLSTK